MRRHLDLIAASLTQSACDALTLDWAALRYSHTAALRELLRQRYAPSTVNQMLCALRRVLQEARKLKLISPEDLADALALKSVPVNAQLKGRLLDDWEVKALLDVCRCDPMPIGRRDAALLVLLLAGGLRRSEAVNLDLVHLDLSSGVLQINGAKGGKNRSIFLPSNSQPLVHDWLAVRGGERGPLLVAISKSQQLLWRRLSTQSVLYILQKRAQSAGLDGCSPHDCRRTYISNLLSAGVDLVTASRLAGHASPLTTAKYDRRGDEAKRRAVELLNFPFS
jgi:site-specific recombinase XerD